MICLFLPPKILLFTATVEAEKQDVLSTHISRIPSATSPPSKICLSEEKKNPGDNILKSYLFPIVFVLRLLYFTLYIFQLIPFCSLFTYFKIKNWGNFSYLFRSIISLKVLLSNKSLSFNCEILPIFDWESWKFLFLLYMHLGDLMNSTNGFYMQ